MTKIYYLISDQVNAGGQFVNIDHVLSLRSLGFNAHLMCMGNENKFFDDLPVVYFKNIRSLEFFFSEDDYVVIPEPARAYLNLFKIMRINKILHCQNPHYIFHGFDTVASLNEYGFSSIITCSDYTTEMLKRSAVAGNIETILPKIPDIFSPKNKKKQIAYMSRKRQIESQYLIGLFKSVKTKYSDVPWIDIKNVNRQSVASAMAESQVFASMSFMEGLGLPPIEAMASGCVVAGFHGGGGLQYANSYQDLWVSDGDYFKFIDAIDLALTISDDASLYLNYFEYSKKIRYLFSQQEFNKRISQVWGSILNRNGIKN